MLSWIVQYYVMYRYIIVAYKLVVPQFDYYSHEFLFVLNKFLPQVKRYSHVCFYEYLTCVCLTLSPVKIPCPPPVCKHTHTICKSMLAANLKNDLSNSLL